MESICQTVYYDQYDLNIRLAWSQPWAEAVPPSAPAKVDCKQGDHGNKGTPLGRATRPKPAGHAGSGYRIPCTAPDYVSGGSLSSTGSAEGASVRPRVLEGPVSPKTSPSVARCCRAGSGTAAGWATVG
jgi:hypothetical protein